MAGQSVMDRVAAVKHSIAGQGLAKSVCKATTEEIIGPKKKHLDYLLQCTNEPNVSIPQMADLLIERTQHTSWVVVFKSLISIHNLMNLGNERFTQYLASNNCSFNLSGFVDKGGVQGYDMSTYIRRYAKYLNEKAVSYRSMAFDFCKVKRGRDDGLLRTMNSEKLLKTLPVLQEQLDALLEFDCTPNELTNGVITACFMLLFKDLIRLFACYNDGIINLLEKYFDMNKKQCKDALFLYKRFLVRMDKVSEFLKVAENMGIDKGDIPDLAKDGKPLPSMIQKAPASLLDALEQHLASLEGKKSATTPTGSKPSGFTTALNNMSSNTFNVSEAEKKRILEEENQQLQKHKGLQSEQKLKDNTSPQRLAAVATASSSSPAANNPFSTGAAPQSSGQSDLFGSPVDNSAKLSDDLLSLGVNPFASNQPTANSSGGSNPFGTPAFQTNGVGGTAANSNSFTSDADFAKAFNNTGTSSSQGSTGFDSAPSQAATTSGAPPGFDAFGDVLAPMNKSPSHQAQASQPARSLGGDLDSSLATLASTLNVSGGTGQLKKDHQWQPKGENKLTGGQSFQRQPIATSTTTNPNPGWGAQPGFQQPPNMMGANVPGGPMMYGQPMNMPMGQPMMGMTPQPMGMQPGMMGMGQQPMMYGAVPPRMGTPVAMGAFGQQPPVQQAPAQSNTNDPFGAL